MTQDINCFRVGFKAGINTEIVKQYYHVSPYIISKKLNCQIYLHSSCFAATTENYSVDVRCFSA